jgi:hypothetical protein
LYGSLDPLGHGILGKRKMPAQNMFWGDRFGSVQDPFGHDWLLATHKEVVPPKEMKRRFETMQAQHQGAAKPTA